VVRRTGGVGDVEHGRSLPLDGAGAAFPLVAHFARWGVFLEVDGFSAFIRKKKQKEKNVFFFQRPRRNFLPG
jgi:hypothetical protein